MKIKRIIYVAAVVNDPESLNKFVDDNMKNKYCHHVTIRFGEIKELPSFIGRTVNFIADLKAFNDKAVAIFGEIQDKEICDYIGKDKYQHITISTADDVKPVYSNNLIEEGTGEFIEETAVECKVGAFVVFEDNSTGWIFEK